MIRRLKGLNGKFELHGARQRHSFCDSRHSNGTDLIGENEKQLRILLLSKNFHYTFIAAVLGTADDETVYKNLVFTRGRVTERQEAVVVIDWEFNNHATTPRENRHA